jgi:hypothetical protein
MVVLRTYFVVAAIGLSSACKSSLVVNSRKLKGGAADKPSGLNRLTLSYDGFNDTVLFVGSYHSISPTALEVLDGGRCAVKSQTPPLPESMTLDSSTCVISGTPVEVLDTREFSIELSDGRGDSVVAPIRFSVAAGVPELTFAGSSPAMGSVGVSMSINPSVLKNNGAAISDCYLAGGSDPLPAWASIDPGTCVISGLPDETVWERQLSLQAKNAVGESVAATVSLSVSREALKSNLISRESGQKHTFFDPIHQMHWVLHLVDGKLASAFSKSGEEWMDSTQMESPATQFALHYKVIAGTGYVFVAVDDGTYGVDVRRGVVGSTGISWGSAVKVFTGTSYGLRFKNPSISSDESNLWVAASRFSGGPVHGWEVVTRQSSSSPVGDLASWNTAGVVSSKSSKAQAISLLPAGGEDMHLIFQDGQSAVGFRFENGSGSWGEHNTNGALGWFGFPGAATLGAGSINTMAVYAGHLYVGGGFRLVDGAPGDYIARWNGSTWTALGSGVNGEIRALAVLGNNLFAGGDFTRAGESGANQVAKWNGSNWTNLGSGVNASVSSLVVKGSDLFVGGNFTLAGGGTANRIARWNGESWFSLGTGVNGQIYALAFMGEELIAGGAFTSAGGVSASRIAKWNGSEWTAFGSGVNQSVHALVATSSTSFIAGGNFTTAGGLSRSYVAQWTGSDWASLGSGVNSFVRTLVALDGSVYVGGYFTLAGGLSASRIAKWDGSAWSPIAAGHASAVFSIVEFNDDLLISGMTGGVSRWNGSNWSSLDGFDGTVYAFAVFNSEVYVGGKFSRIGGIAASNLARWNGSEWSAVGSGVIGDVRAFLVTGSSLVIAGQFEGPGTNIVRWDGVNWTDLDPDGFTEKIDELAVDDSFLYAGGHFTDGQFVMRRSESSGLWSEVGSGVNGEVYALAVNDDNVYIGGDFTTVGTGDDEETVNGIVRWDGWTFYKLESGGIAGVNGGVRSIAIEGSNVYIAGAFSQAGALGVNNIAKWNGSGWAALGSGILGDEVSELLFSGGELIAVETSLDPSSTQLRKWNGSSWSTLGPLLGRNIYTEQSQGIRAVVVNDGEVCVSTASGVQCLAPSVANIQEDEGLNVSALYTGEPVIGYINGTTGDLEVKWLNAGGWSQPLTVESGADYIGAVSVTATDEGLMTFYQNRSSGKDYIGQKITGSPLTPESPLTVLESSDMTLYQPSCDPWATGGIIKCLFFEWNTGGYPALRSIVFN